jgi:hypothetical protein
LLFIITPHRNGIAAKHLHLNTANKPGSGALLNYDRFVISL